MAEIFAKRDFAYGEGPNHARVEVRRGERLDVDRLSANRVDVEKMIRTGYAERPEIVVVEAPKRKRGRPRKQA